MKKFLTFLFALLFPVLFILYFVCAVAWRMLKDCVLYVRQEYLTAKKEFERVNGTDIS